MNKIHFIIIIISIFVIISCALVKTIKEGLTPSNNIILIGDSVLNNAAYVPPGKAVLDYLKQKTNNVFNFAKDGSTIQDAIDQILNIPPNFNNSNSYFFISVGGNDILNLRNMLTNSEIDVLFSKYIQLIDTIKLKFGGVNINVCNLYLPSDPRYLNYKPSIDYWNQLIQKNSNRIGAMYNVVDLFNLLNTPNDFIYGIEPSKDGSVKIANIIYITT